MKDDIIDFIKTNPSASSKDVHLGLAATSRYDTIKRVLSKLHEEGLIATEGKGKSTRYVLSSTYKLFYPIEINEYFENEQDQREIKDAFDFGIIDVLRNVDIFTLEENKHLNSLHEKYLQIIPINI